MKSILTLTMNPALDMFLDVPWMKPDRKLRCSDPTYAPGGGGVNVSRAIAEALLEAGASDDITVAATHGLLMKDARQRLDSCPVRRVFITDSTRHRECARMKLRVVSIAPLLADTLRRIIPSEPAAREERGAFEVLL